MPFSDLDVCVLSDIFCLTCSVKAFCSFMGFVYVYGNVNNCNQLENLISNFHECVITEAIEVACKDNGRYSI